MDVALFGAAGYSGLELVKLLSVHPHARMVCAASDSNAGKPHGRGGQFVTTKQALETKADAALLAVPPDAAQELAPQLLAKGMRVVDLSHAYRAPQAGVQSVYGLTSMFAADVASAKLVANPGCYATCAIVALAPIVALTEGPLAVSAGSGVTGAGRSATEAMSLGEMYGEVRAYKVLRHQHTPEIERALGVSNRVVLTTHLLPVARGIFMTITAKLAKPFDIGVYHAMYRDDPTIEVVDVEDVSLRKVVGTPLCMVGAAANDQVVVVTAALDNLLKGAASQAIENLNLMFGHPRMAGLEHLARHA